jgi:hypothetical protein
VDVGVLENKFWLEASGPNYGQVCRYVVCLDERKKVRGWFLTITISVRFSHISCPFANTGCKRCQIGYIDLTFKQSLYNQINQTETLYRYVLFIEVMESWKILSLELQLRWAVLEIGICLLKLSLFWKFTAHFYGF